MREVGVLDFCASRFGLYSFVLSRLVPTSKKVGEVVGICFERLASLASRDKFMSSDEFASSGC